VTARVERVLTDAGVHGRIVGGNGEIVWTTEVLTSYANLNRAIEILGELDLSDQHLTDDVVDVDERADQQEEPWVPELPE
jgi:hypothetical protein